MKCRCQHCDRVMEFPAHIRNKQAPCPYCHQPTWLYFDPRVDDEACGVKIPRANGRHTLETLRLRVRRLRDRLLTWLRRHRRRLLWGGLITLLVSGLGAFVWWAHRKGALQPIAEELGVKLGEMWMFGVILFLLYLAVAWALFPVVTYFQLAKIISKLK